MNYQEICWEISENKRLLRDTDYKALKHADGVIPDEEYEEVKEERQAYRDRINELEALLPEALKEYETEKAEEEARMQDEMEQAMAKQEEYGADFEAFQNGDMSWDDFSQKYPERISTNEGEDYTDIDIPDSDIILDDSGDDGERGLLEYKRT